MIYARGQSCLTLFSILFNYVENGGECSLSSFADATELAGVTDMTVTSDMTEVCAVMKRDLNSLEK